MGEKPRLYQRKLNARFTLWSKMRDKLDFWHWQIWRIKVISNWMVVLDRVNKEELKIIYRVESGE
jgi:hypothetical protein